MRLIKIKERIYQGQNNKDILGTKKQEYIWGKKARIYQGKKDISVAK